MRLHSVQYMMSLHQSDQRVLISEQQPQEYLYKPTNTKYPVQ